MTAFTLRLETPLAKKLDQICRQKGFSKTGLVKSLIRNFIDEQIQPAKTKPDKQKNKQNSLVGIVTLGGDAVLDANSIFE